MYTVVTKISLSGPVETAATVQKPEICQIQSRRFSDNKSENTLNAKRLCNINNLLEYSPIEKQVLAFQNASRSLA